MEGDAKIKKELETRLIEKVGEVISEIKTTAKNVDHVICSLHSLALLLFPVDSSQVLGESASISINYAFLNFGFP